MEKHKYLEEIIPQDQIMQNLSPGDKREEQWDEERAEYGFDERETWSMDVTFIQWLYERLRMYKDIGGQIVDLEFHKFNVDGSEMTQLEIINRIIEVCEQELKDDDLWGENHYRNEQEICKLWGIVIPSMWW